MVGRAVVCALVMLVIGCGCASNDAGTGPPASVLVSPAPSSTPSPSPSLSPSASSAPTSRASTAAYSAVRFTGLPSGTFPTHVHSVCSGSQTFHIAVMQSLVVRGGSGDIQVPVGYIGRGLCLIIYSSSSLSRVLTTRRI